MKQHNKKIIYLLVLFIGFFVGINSVKALKCTYKLPFSGIDSSSGRYVTPNDNMRCYQDAGLHYCFALANVYNNDFASGPKCTGAGVFHYIEAEWADRFTPPGYSENTIDGKDGSYNKYHLYKMLGTDGTNNDLVIIPNGGEKTNIKRNEKCPKYLVVEKTTNTVFIQNSSQYKDVFVSKNTAAGNLCTAGDDANIITPISWDSSGKKDKYVMAYQGSNDDNTYRSYLKSFYNINASSQGNNSISISSFDLNKYVMPLYEKSYSGETQIPQLEDVKAATRVYVETFDKAWYNRMNSFQKSLESDCGSDWYSYINRKNYNIGSSALFDYAEKSYNSSNLKSQDKGISKKCWNTRADFFKAFESLQLYMYGMGANTIASFENISNINENTIEEYTAKLKAASESEASSQNLYYRVYLEDDTRVQHFKYLLYFFEGVKIGTTFTPETFRSSANTMVNEKSDSQYRIKVLEADQCAYLCANVEDSDNYNKCKTNNTSYSKCLTALSKCGGKVCTDCINKDYGTEFDNCVNSSSCPKVEASCMESNGISNYESESKAVLEAAKTAKDELDKAAEYTYEPASLPTITWKSKKYEPKCEDVKVFTWMWTGVTILAPFLLIIFASFDYFKAVMAADEEKMKQSKKKAPLRLIALILLIIIPALIRILLTQAGTNRANNVTYLRCIVTGDYGE